MKLLIAIVSSDDASNVQKALIKEQYQVTKLSTTGGFLMKGNTTFLVGAEDKKYLRLLKLSDHNLKNVKKLFQTLLSMNLEC